MEQLILDLLNGPKAYTVKEIANELGIKNENDVRMVLTTLCDEFKVHQTKKNKYVFLLMQYIYSSNTEICLDQVIKLITSLTTEIKIKNSTIKELESLVEAYKTEQDLDEVDKFIDELSEDVKSEDNINIVSNIISTKSAVNNQVKLPSQKSYIKIDNFDIFV